MFIKDNFSKSYFENQREYIKNLKSTKFFLRSLLVDFKNYKIPLLDTYDKNYHFDFSNFTVKKFSKYKNIIIIGMGGSILGTRSIYSFLKKKN